MNLDKGKGKYLDFLGRTDEKSATNCVNGQFLDPTGFRTPFAFCVSGGASPISMSISTSEGSPGGQVFLRDNFTNLGLFLDAPREAL